MRTMRSPRTSTLVFARDRKIARIEQTRVADHEIALGRVHELFREPRGALVGGLVLRFDQRRHVAFAYRSARRRTSSIRCRRCCRRASSQIGAGWKPSPSMRYWLTTRLAAGDARAAGRLDVRLAGRQQRQRVTGRLQERARQHAEELGRRVGRYVERRTVERHARPVRCGSSRSPCRPSSEKCSSTGAFM